MISVLHICSLIEPLGVSSLGGAERFLSTLAAYQARVQNLDVWCHAVSGSQIENPVKHLDLQVPHGALRSVDIARDYSKFPSSPTETHERQAREQKAFAPLLHWLEKNRAKIDVIHNHSFDELPFFALNSLRIPIVHTLHLPPILPWINERFQAEPSVCTARYVTVSEHNQKAYEEKANIHPLIIPCGENLEKIPFNPSPGEHFLWVGRISPEKGLDRALDIIERFGKPLRVLGGVYDQNYFHTLENRLEHPLVDYRGKVSHSEVLLEMSQARALIFTPVWEEPFGLVVIESLAAGTPVVSFNRGAISQMVKHGKTGFLANSSEEMCTALARIQQISRIHCREHALKNFSLPSVAERYLNLYQELIETPRRLPS